MRPHGLGCSGGRFFVTRSEMLRLAVPSTLYAVLRQAYRTVDHYWIQHVSTEAQAAIGSSTFVLIVFAGAFAVLSAGAAPLVARSVGVGDGRGLRASLGAACLISECGRDVEPNVPYGAGLRPVGWRGLRCGW